MEPSDERPSATDYARALLRVRAFWPLPALLLLAIALALAAPEVWQARTSLRKTLSLAELCIVTSALGTVLYWLVLALAHKGMLQGPRSFAMRAPSEAEQQLAELALRGLCLGMVYAGPLLLWLVD